MTSTSVLEAQFKNLNINNQTKKKPENPRSRGLADIMFSWSLEDIFNQQLYNPKIRKIPQAFDSVEQYVGSYVYPLLEETRAELCSSMDPISKAPYAEVRTWESVNGRGFIRIDVSGWENGKTSIIPGDVFILSDVKPRVVSDLQRVGKTWTFASLFIPKGADISSSNLRSFVVKTSKKNFEMIKNKPWFVVYLVNIIPQRRIWNSLHMNRKSDILEEVLGNSSSPSHCDICIERSSVERNGNLFLELNESQVNAVCSCFEKTSCNHKSAIELIWGPPGTGKTKTVSVLLFKLLKNKCPTIACAPTNIAIMQLASRVLLLVKQKHEEDSNGGSEGPFCCLGEILLFGHKERLKVGSADECIHLDYRVQQLENCFSPLTGWRHRFQSMIGFLELELPAGFKLFNNGRKSFNEIKKFENRFKTVARSLRECLKIFCTHIPRSFLQHNNFRMMEAVTILIVSLDSLLFQMISAFLNVDDPEELVEFMSGSFANLMNTRNSCVLELKSLRDSLEGLKLPCTTFRKKLVEFCFKNASLFFCTVSSSFKLHLMPVKPVKTVVIDEAAQLKECESAIVLRLQGVQNAVLIGDECQLPATVESKVAETAGFGRSLFERLSSLGHRKHLLNIQYRMHPFISRFPNRKFYSSKISDGPNVKSQNHTKKYLNGRIFGPYSFINIRNGREQSGENGHSWKNTAEVTAVLKILNKLQKGT